MDVHVVICLIIFILTMISFVWGKLPLAVTAMLSLAAYFFTGCINTKEALAGFSDSNTILIGSMFVVAAGFSKTQFVHHCAHLIDRISAGSWTKTMAGYLLITALLAQFILSPSAVFTIVFPMILASCEEKGISPSKVMFPVGLCAIATCAIFPVGASLSLYAQFNGYLQTYGYTKYQFGIWDICIARIPELIFTLIYCTFFAAKFTPDKPLISLTNIAADIKNNQTATLPRLQEIMGFAIFIMVSAGMIFQTVLKIPAWAICLGGALLMILFGVLKEKEVYRAIPASLLFLFIGALATGAALTATGAGKIIGDTFAKIALSLGNNYLIAAMFFGIPFILTQVMNNTAIVAIFVPIAILAAKSMGGNPIGLCSLVVSAELCAFMTPMGTPTAAMMMELGGYNVRSMVKQGILPGLFIWILSSFWIGYFFPVL
jgi:solute carrier family 13 (sodium-dependent dicarboxylate transporter), member 2/3/5